jgi:hypothetical protein
MARRKLDTPPPTPEEVKALADKLGRSGQFNFLIQCLKDENCHVGNFIKALIKIDFDKTEYLEKLAGLSPADIDPDGLLSTVETDKEAKKRTKRQTEGAVRKARHDAKKRRERSMLPPFSAPAP